MTRGLVSASFLAVGLAAGPLSAEPLSRAEAVAAALAANPEVRRSRAGVEQARASDLRATRRSSRRAARGCGRSS